MSGFPILTFMTFLPLLAAIWILTIRGDEESVAANARSTALFASAMTFVLALVVWGYFDPDTTDFQMVEELPWLIDYDIAYRMGVDGISLVFILLSTFLTPICILASWESVKHRVREYMAAFLVLETMMVGMFCSLDALLFYIFFEGVLIPMFLIIGVWGGARRVYAAFKFFLYTLLGSVLMLLALMAMYWHAGSTDIRVLMAADFPISWQSWLFIAFFASFAVKVPMWPVHTWLPAAHVEAPTAGSVILAGVLLKMGGYGFLRFNIPMLPFATQDFAPFVFTLSVIAIVVTSLIALAQSDMKKLIAYSSVAHMGYVTAGLFSMTHQGLDGAMFQMLSHGIVSSALFLCVGVVYDRLHTREIARYGGLANNMPRYAIVFMLMMLASVGLPGTSGFVGEFLVIMGTFQVNTWLGLFIASGVVLGATYMLVLYRKVVFGKLVNEDLKAMTDLSRREIAVFAPLVVLVLVMGIYPTGFSYMYQAAIEQIIANHQIALAGPAPVLASN